VRQRLHFCCTTDYQNNECCVKNCGKAKLAMAQKGGDIFTYSITAFGGSAGGKKFNFKPAFKAAHSSALVCATV
jgi:hypothetical protein